MSPFDCARPPCCRLREWTVFVLMVWGVGLVAVTTVVVNNIQHVFRILILVCAYGLFGPTCLLFALLDDVFHIFTHADFEHWLCVAAFQIFTVWCLGSLFLQYYERIPWFARIGLVAACAGCGAAAWALGFR